ncbi:Coiled-coil domain-containing protein 90B, mitochondrial [Linum perenne]
MCKRLVQSGAHLVKLRLLDANSSLAARKFDHGRHFSQLARPNGANRAFIVDRSALVSRLESQEVPSNQAEGISKVLVAVLNDSIESFSQSCGSKEEMHKSERIQELSLSKFKAEAQSSQVAREMILHSKFSKFQNEIQSTLAKFQSELQSNLSKFQTEVQSSQDHQSSMLQREIVNRKTDIDKVNEKLQYEIDKATAGQRLDLNLERGRTRDELANQKTETANLTNKLDREIHELRANVEASKYDIIKYCIRTLVSISAMGLVGVYIFSSPN